MPSPRKPDAPERLTRDRWLAAALGVLRERGIGGVKIVPIARVIGVTTGSFYWHFRDREDLLGSMLDYWATEMTGRVIEELTAVADAPAPDRLRALMEAVTAGRRADYEIAIRAWAAYDPAAAQVVRRVDQQRLETLRGMFRDMGFSGDALEMRVRLLLSSEMGEPAILVRESGARRRKLLELRHALLTRGGGDPN